MVRVKRKELMINDTEKERVNRRETEQVESKILINVRLPYNQTYVL